MIEYHFTAIMTGRGSKRPVQLAGPDIYGALAEAQGRDPNMEYEFHRVDAILVSGIPIWKRMPTVTVAYASERRIEWVTSTADIVGDICLTIKGSQDTDRNIGNAKREYARIKVEALRQEALSEDTQEQLFKIFELLGDPAKAESV